MHIFWFFVNKYKQIIKNTLDFLSSLIAIRRESSDNINFDRAPVLSLQGAIEEK